MPERKIVIWILLGLLVTHCNLWDHELEHESIEFDWFPIPAENIADLNTEFDDYNSHANHVGKRIYLYYSTNKDSKGSNYDISSRGIDAVVGLNNHTFSFSISNAAAPYSSKLFPLINSEFDEFGPFMFHNDSARNSYSWWYFMYANNENSDFDIRFAYSSLGDWGHWDSQQRISGPLLANNLNSRFDDFYPTINAEHTKMFFSSNRDNGYNIYEVGIDFDNIVDWLQDTTAIPSINHILSSDSDDKCPYINGNLMVFTSNRSGGYGGFDLYFSIYSDGNWSEPTNFGPQINTEYDEYRPAIEAFEFSTNDLMIFSSNRPGGKGGYDLYYAGINKMIE